MLCPHAPVFALADRPSRGIHNSPPLRLGVDPLLPHRCLATLLHRASQLPLGAPSASPHVTVSRPLAGHPGWDTKPINTSPGASEVAHKLAVPGQDGPVVGLNEGGLCPEEKPRRRSRSSALITAYGLPSYPGACWSPLNGTPS